MILDVNSSAEALMGATRRQLVGTSIVDAVAPAARRRSAQEWDGFRRSGGYAGSRTLVRADGREVDVSFAAVLATVEDRTVAVYVMTNAPSGHVIAGYHQPPSRNSLTKREREVITLIAMGDEAPEVADALYIAPTTVKAHVRNAMEKLGARTRAQLVALTLSTDGAIHLPSVARV